MYVDTDWIMEVQWSLSLSRLCAEFLRYSVADGL